MQTTRVREQEDKQQEPGEGAVVELYMGICLRLFGCHGVRKPQITLCPEVKNVAFVIIYIEVYT